MKSLLTQFVFITSFVVTLFAWGDAPHASSPAYRCLEGRRVAVTRTDRTQFQGILVRVSAKHIFVLRGSNGMVQVPLSKVASVRLSSSPEQPGALDNLGWGGAVMGRCPRPVPPPRQKRRRAVSVKDLSSDSKSSARLLARAQRKRKGGAIAVIVGLVGVGAGLAVLIPSINTGKKCDGDSWPGACKAFTRMGTVVGGIGLAAGVVSTVVGLVLLGQSSTLRERAEKRAQQILRQPRVDPNHERRLAKTIAVGHPAAASVHWQLTF